MATGRRCLAVPTDVKNEEQVVRMVQHYDRRLRFKTRRFFLYRN
jgi:hypothetical protein